MNGKVFLMDFFEEYFLAKPERLVRFGQYLALLGGWIIILALVGQVATGAVNVVGNIGRHASTVKMLADIYPSIPTWWVPESIIGAMPAVVGLVVGFWMNQTGKRYQRILGQVGD